MNGLVSRLVVIAIAVPTMGAYAAWEKGKRVETYHITAIDEPIMEKCSRLMSGKDVTFAQGATVGKGCACIAKHATSEIKATELPVFTETLGTTLELAKRSINLSANDEAGFEALVTKAETDLTKIQEKAGMNDVQFERLYTHVSEYISTCGQKATHKGESLSRIAALTPLGTPRTASTVERLTPDRQKSDAEVASMLR